MIQRLAMEGTEPSMSGSWHMPSRAEGPGPLIGPGPLMRAISRASTWSLNRPGCSKSDPCASPAPSLTAPAPALPPGRSPVGRIPPGRKLGPGPICISNSRPGTRASWPDWRNTVMILMSFGPAVDVTRHWFGMIQEPGWAGGDSVRPVGLIETTRAFRPDTSSVLWIMFIQYSPWWTT